MMPPGHNQNKSPRNRQPGRCRMSASNAWRISLMFVLFVLGVISIVAVFALLPGSNERRTP